MSNVYAGKQRRRRGLHGRRQCGLAREVGFDPAHVDGLVELEGSGIREILIFQDGRVIPKLVGAHLPDQNQDWDSGWEKYAADYAAQAEPTLG